MPTWKRVRELADRIEKVYPKTLAGRLTWFCKTLGVDRVRILRLMGMTRQQARRNQERTWAEILADPEWEDKGSWVEGLLHDALASFQYDWEGLAEYLHQAAGQTAGPNGSTLPRAAGNDSDRAELLLARVG